MDDSAAPTTPKGWMLLPDGSYLRESMVYRVEDNGDDTTTLYVTGGESVPGGPLRDVLGALDGRPPRAPKPEHPEKPPKPERE